MKKFEFIQNLHEFERIRAILENFSENSKIVFHVFKLGGVIINSKLKFLVKNRNFGLRDLFHTTSCLTRNTNRPQTYFS